MMPAFALVATFSLVACGGGNGGGDGSDESYLRTLCGAMSNFQTEFAELFENADLSTTDDLSDFMDEAASLVADVVDDLEGANAPADVEEVHESLVSVLSQFQDALEDGDFGALEDFDPPDLEVPADVEARLDAAAVEIEECQDLEGELF